MQESKDHSLGVLIQQLQERGRQIIVGHYYQQMSFVQLAELWG
ncbi:hypothetical protein [Pseudomonas sp. Irchel 3E13]|nr:hypothetical protein [Pseudomonas sp. Irchel 3E13]